MLQSELLKIHMFHNCFNKWQTNSDIYIYANSNLFMAIITSSTEKGHIFQVYKYQSQY